MIVIDASAAIEWVLQTPKGAQIEVRIFRKAGESPRLHAPHGRDERMSHRPPPRHVRVGLVLAAAVLLHVHHQAVPEPEHVVANG